MRISIRTYPAQNQTAHVMNGGTTIVRITFMWAESQFRVRILPSARHLFFLGYCLQKDAATSAETGLRPSLDLDQRERRLWLKT